MIWCEQNIDQRETRLSRQNEYQTTQQKNSDHIGVHTHKIDIHIQLAYATDHVWMNYIFVRSQCNAKNKNLKMPMLQHANEATKKMKNAFSYEAEKLFSTNQIL